MVWPCYRFVDGLSHKCINVYIYKKLSNHDCLPILMLLCIMLYIMFACLMLFAALSNAICLYNVFFSFVAVIDLCKCFWFSCFVLVYLHIISLFHVLLCIMHSAS